MPEANVIREHMEVLGSDGAHVGTIDHVEDHRLKLTRSDGTDGSHQYLPTRLVADIRGNSVTLTLTAEEAGEAATAG